jgi:hypothetical protein
MFNTITTIQICINLCLYYIWIWVFLTNFTIGIDKTSTSNFNNTEIITGNILNGSYQYTELPKSELTYPYL